MPEMPQSLIWHYSVHAEWRHFNVTSLQRRDGCCCVPNYSSLKNSQRARDASRPNFSGFTQSWDGFRVRKLRTRCHGHLPSAVLGKSNSQASCTVDCLCARGWRVFGFGRKVLGLFSKEWSFLRSVRRVDLYNSSPPYCARTSSLWFQTSIVGLP